MKKIKSLNKKLNIIFTIIFIINDNFLIFNILQILKSIINEKLYKQYHFLYFIIKR